MRIYAIRDRLLDYYQQPFIAQDDKPVLGAISNQLHNGANIDWQNAPHHFEIWRLGKVTQEGYIEQDRELLATLDSLIRPDLRQPNRKPRETESEIPPGRSPRTAGVEREDPYPEDHPAQNTPHATPGATTQARQGPDGILLSRGK